MIIAEINNIEDENNGENAMLAKVAFLKRPTTLINL